MSEFACILHRVAAKVIKVLEKQTDEVVKSVLDEAPKHLLYEVIVIALEQNNIAVLRRIRSYVPEINADAIPQLPSHISMDLSPELA